MLNSPSVQTFPSIFATHNLPGKEARTKTLIADLQQRDWIMVYPATHKSRCDVF